jgi:trans-aconitate methyltransferase
MRNPTDVFGEWAEQGKDLGMEKGHAVAVDDMINFALQERRAIGRQFSFLDLGCGNGWTVKKVLSDDLCNTAAGIDGAKSMIDKAKIDNVDAEYILADINTYNSVQKYDLIHSMEVLYYLESPSDIVQKISSSWLNPNGRLIVGIDHYHENNESHSWQEKLDTRMIMLHEAKWVEIFKGAGLKEITSWRSNQNKNWAGTLVLTGKK